MRSHETHTHHHIQSSKLAKLDAHFFKLASKHIYTQTASHMGGAATHTLRYARLHCYIWKDTSEKNSSARRQNDKHFVKPIKQICSFCVCVFFSFYWCCGSVWLGRTYLSVDLRRSLGECGAYICILQMKHYINMITECDGRIKIIIYSYIPSGMNGYRQKCYVNTQ